MPIRIVRLGSARGEGEGARLGTVRRPPRGVKKSDYARLDFYDAWLPELAPSEKLRKWLFGARPFGDAVWRRYARAYRSEMNTPERKRLIEAFARLSHGANFSMGCYCEDYAHCHRSLLKELLEEHGADVVVADDSAERPRRAP
jgi:uncharacterized protein YeaO (DUF488 family)